MKLLKRNLLIICLVPLLQGCFVIGIANKPTWKTSDPVIETNSTFNTEIKLNRPNFLFPLPLFFLSFDKKQYALTFKVNSKFINNLDIDSISVLISDINSGKTIVPIFTKQNTNFKFAVDTAVSNYTYSETTEALIKIPREMCDTDLEVQYNIYVKGLQQPFAEKKKLTITKYNIIWIESFF